MDEDEDRYDQDGPGLLDAVDPPTKPATRTARAASTKTTSPKAAAIKTATPKTAARKTPATKTAATAKPTAEPAGEQTPPLALYRRYRPDTFDEVIGQDHVTEPLKRALANNKVNHAYLFSGPRGCGKTSSARILARCLNCEQGPTATPCSKCRSCRDLATGGPGSIDVIEMDAASHGLVDDARDLRERAFYVPVQSRFKVYIIDEAHMVTTQGFNALLKLVEEPPPHVKFIFATTEPDKVIGTIRSRTHHYPFRLVPPKTMQTFLAHVCEQEGVQVEPAVLPLVVRAGAGSVRDCLSVLDQLLGSSDASGVSYDAAAALLGYTPDRLLDDIMDAFATKDGGLVYATIDKVIEAGQDAGRFGTDLLQRLRDVLVISLVPDALKSGLINVPADQAERLQAQADAMGAARLTQAADVISAGLTGMRGTTAPRLHLELMCAQVLAPQEDVTALVSRITRLERKLVAGVPAGPSPQAVPAGPTPARPVPQPAQPSPAPAPEPTGMGLAGMRQAWPSVLDRVKQARRFSWILLSQNCELVDVSGNTLTIGFSNAGAKDSFSSGASSQVLAEALAGVTGVTWHINPILTGPDHATQRPPASQPAPAPTPAPSRPTPTAPHRVGAIASTTVYAEDDTQGASDDDILLSDDIGGQVDAAALLSSQFGAELIEDEDYDV